MSHAVDLFWSFRSPYSYLATGRIAGLAKTYDLDVNVRPVYPIAIRTPEFFKAVNPMWVAYLLRDTQRVAQMNNIAFTWPRPDPVVMNLETREIPKEQPYIHRLTFLGVEAGRRGKGLPFIDEVSQIIWNGSVDGWDQGDHLAKAAERAGLDLTAMDEAVKDHDAYDAAVNENQAALEKAGHWGVPTLVYKGEPFFGQDRIDLCLWRMKQDGLKERA